MSASLLPLPGLVFLPQSAAPSISAAAPVSPPQGWATVDATIIFRIQSFLPRGTILPVNKHWIGATRFKQSLETVAQSIDPQTLTPECFKAQASELAKRYKQPLGSVAIHLYETIVTTPNWQIFISFQKAIQDALDSSTDGPYIAAEKAAIRQKIDQLRSQIFKLKEERGILHAKLKEAGTLGDAALAMYLASEKAVADELNCSICLGSITSLSERVDTACFHVFHQQCINSWRSLDNTCPNCRGNLDAIPDKDALAKHKNAKDALIVKEATALQAMVEASKTTIKACIAYQDCLYQLSEASEKMDSLPYLYLSVDGEVRRDRTAQAAFLRIFTQEGQAVSLIRALRDSL